MLFLVVFKNKNYNSFCELLFIDHPLPYLPVLGCGKEGDFWSVGHPTLQINRVNTSYEFNTNGNVILLSRKITFSLVLNS